MKIIAGLVLVGFLGFFSNANAAIIKILEDHLSVINATYSPYGINDFQEYSGPIIGANFVQKAVTEVTEEPKTEGSYYSDSRVESIVNDTQILLRINHNLDSPWYHPINPPGYSLAVDNLLLAFKVSGDSASVYMDGWPGEITYWAVQTFSLYDLTTGDNYLGAGQYELIDKHCYILNYNLFVQTTGDPYPYFKVNFNNATIPEPSILILLGAGLAGLGFTRKHLS